MMSVLFIAGATSSVTDNYTVKYIVLVANAKRLAVTFGVRF